MAMTKTAGVTKVKQGTALKKAAPMKKAAPKKAAPAKVAAPKAAIKKPAPVRLTGPQQDLLKKVSVYTDPAGYHTDKKAENKVLETLRSHKLVKTLKKHPVTGHFHYQVSTAGTKHLTSGPAPKS